MSYTRSSDYISLHNKISILNELKRAHLKTLLGERVMAPSKKEALGLEKFRAVCCCLWGVVYLTLYS